jgi:lipopolysaccharide O-acetyltransferase
MGRPLISKGPVIIGPNSWIGDGAVITPGCTVGQGSIIGANSVVTTDIPEFTVAAGIPARCIKKFDFALEKWTSVT